MNMADLIAALDDGADLAVGSRNVPNGGVEGWGLGRQVLSKGGSLYSRLILGVDVHDLTTGFKAYSRRALQVIGVDQIATDIQPGVGVEDVEPTGQRQNALGQGRALRRVQQVQHQGQGASAQPVAGACQGGCVAVNQHDLRAGQNHRLGTG